MAWPRRSHGLCESGLERGAPMRILPDNPSMDFLRREAKDLLAALRLETPDLTLSQAQADLANRYGFRTWPDLKAEVRHLRRAAPKADAALASGLAEALDLRTVT